MKKKILFVCTANRYRSRTAEEIYREKENCLVKSAGTDKSAETQITEKLLNWADLIIVMEKRHRNWIGKKFREIYKGKPIKCLEIPDEYDFMQPELVILIKQKMSRYLT